MAAHLNKTNLRRADLNGTDLDSANLTGAILTNTCLDPNNPIPECNLSEFERQGDFIIGYRTKESQVMGYTIYEPGEMYEAPWFSTSNWSCHPGLYLATLDWLDNAGYVSAYEPNFGLVQVMALASEVHQAGDKFRAKRLWVM
jgi:uncharacterized protein YjbI with pentapeptide repeats